MARASSSVVADTQAVDMASVPRLMAALRRADRLTDAEVAPDAAPGDAAIDAWRSLVTLYQIGHAELDGSPTNAALPDLAVDDEARLAARVTLDIAERLRRLDEAYAAWQDFDAAAYFDLTAPQAATLVQISERVSTVHTVFYVDWLLPSFQRAQRFWFANFCPQYRAAHRFLHSNGSAAPDLSLDLATPFDATAFDRDRFRAMRAAMIEHVQRLFAVLYAARDALHQEVAYLATNGSDIERGRVALAWQSPAAAGLRAPSGNEALLPALGAVPTLTRSFTFPLPAHKQPGRLRRLRRNRERARFRRERLS